MDVLTLKEMVAREEAAFACGITPIALMEAAGQGMAERITSIYPHVDHFLVLVGKGNNGGDGLVVACHLGLAGKKVRVILTTAEENLGELPRTQLAKLRSACPDLDVSPWREDFVFPGSDAVVIDALLGIQARGALRGAIGEVVAKLNAARSARFFRVVALDLPTGLASFEEGQPPENEDAAVFADVTIAVGFAKEVLVRETLAAWVGRLEIVPWSQEPDRSATHQVLVPYELAGLLPRRGANSYKGDFGKLAIVAGSLGFTGAPVLCANAAEGMGVGLLSVVTRQDAHAIVAASSPHEAMVSGWHDDGLIPPVIENASAIVIGPGLGNDEKTVKMLHTVLSCGHPVLIDADGLNALAQNMDLLKATKAPVVLTPHVGEMARLIGRKFHPDEREAVAREFVEKHEGVTLVLKGTRTLITANGEPFHINTTGNPGLSTGGTGDTLSGIIGALLAHGLPALDAARLGVWLHGHAADLVLSERGCEEGLTPTMLSAHLGAALVSLRAQAITPPGLVERSSS